MPARRDSSVDPWTSQRSASSRAVSPVPRSAHDWRMKWTACAARGLRGTPCSTSRAEPSGARPARSSRHFSICSQNQASSASA